MRTVSLPILCLFTILIFALAHGLDQIPTNATSSVSEASNELDSLKIGNLISTFTKILGLLNLVLNLLKPEQQLTFLLYTELNPTVPQELLIDDIGSVTQSNFNSSHPTKFISHGWMSDSDQEVNTLLRDAFLSKGPHNIIVLNWVQDSFGIYAESIKHVPPIGEKLGVFIDFMAQHGWLKPENLTLIGHSLGSHICGIAARSLKSGQIHTIIALDPASPGFSYDTSKLRLRMSDAYYVESIQTTALAIGYEEPIGKAAFYPNGGVIQPGCGADLIGSCAHFRSYVYYAEAVRNGGFPSIRCKDQYDVHSVNCGNRFSKTVRMGDPKNADSAKGIFYVPVFPNPPYSFSTK